MITPMRTPLTLDPDVAERLRQEVASGRFSFKQIVNERKALQAELEDKKEQVRRRA